MLLEFPVRLIALLPGLVPADGGRAFGRAGGVVRGSGQRQTARDGGEVLIARRNLDLGRIRARPDPHELQLRACRGGVGTGPGKNVDVAAEDQDLAAEHLDRRRD